MNEVNSGKFQLQKWFSPVAVLFFIYALFFLPFWQPLFLGFTFACACTPLVSTLQSRMHSTRKSTAYFLMAILFLMVVIILGVGGLKIYSLVYTALQDSEGMGSQFDRLEVLKNQLINYLRHIPFVDEQQIEQQVNRSLTSMGIQVRDFLIGGAKNLLVQTPQILLNIFVFLLSFAVVLAWGPRKWIFISRFSIFGESSNLDKYRKFERVCGISIGSILLVGLIQATLVSIGCMITGYPGFISFLGSFILSLIPIIGAGSVPFVLSLLSFASDSASAGMILAITTVIVGTSDNLIRAWLFSKAAQTNPAVSLLALLGAISLFGFTGLFLAPVIEQLTMSYLFSDSESKPAKA